jgi:hypothetical protein
MFDKSEDLPLQCSAALFSGRTLDTISCDRLDWRGFVSKDNPITARRRQLDLAGSLEPDRLKPSKIERSENPYPGITRDWSLWNLSSQVDTCEPPG